VLRALVALILIAAVLRAAVLIRSVPAGSSTPPDVDLRQALGLPGSHRLRQLVAAERSPQAGWAALWLDEVGGATAIVPDGAGRLRMSRDQATVTQLVATIQEPLTLRDLDVSAWPALPEPLSHLSLWVWDPTVPVYVTAGPDGQPGIAGIDDDGDGVIDDLGELGASHSDDRVVAPHQSGYSEAVAGEIIARVISRGSLVVAQGELLLPPRGPADASEDSAAEVWLEFAAMDHGLTTGAPAAAPPPARIFLQVDWSE
jgi:hypothetical protein